jgi:cell division protein FtsQ
MDNRKLNMKRVRNAIVWLVLMSGIAALLFFSIARKKNASVKTLVINIEDINSGEAMISDKEVIQMLNLAAGRTITKSNVQKLNIRKLEAKLQKDKRIERADIYFDSKNRLTVDIKQKEPIVRISDVYGNSYYLDINGKYIPVTVGSAIRVPLATGIRDTFSNKLMASDKISKLKDVFKIMQYVSKDPFLKSLIEQVHVEQDSIADIVLIPKIGRSKLILGNALYIDEKFDNLKVFYRDGFPRLGWSRYKSLNLKYADQIIGKLSDPQAAKIKLIPGVKVSDTLQAGLITTDNKQVSIHN